MAADAVLAGAAESLDAGVAQADGALAGGVDQLRPSTDVRVRRRAGRRQLAAATSSGASAKASVAWVSTRHNEPAKHRSASPRDRSWATWATGSPSSGRISSS